MQPKVVHNRVADIPHNASICTDEVEDPYDPTTTITVARSLRNDQLASMLNRSQILRYHYAAGRAWQRLYHQAEIGAPRSIDATVLRVDGSAPIADRDRRRIQAIRRLNRIRIRIGLSGEAILRDTLVAGMTLRAIAEARSLDARPGSSDLVYLGRRLRECLDTAAHELGLA